jgi:hypothetical protein
MPGNARRLFSERKAHAFRGNLAPRINVNGSENIETKEHEKKNS